MKKYLNLSIVATFVISTLSYNVANAKNNQPLSIKDESINAKNSNEDIRVFVNNQQRSLYQIALLSGISITELREINKGDYDNIDVVKIGDSIVLPANSPLLPAVSNKETSKGEKYNLPSLGSLDTVDAKTDDSMERQVASVLQTLGQQDWENMTSEKLKQDLSNKTQDYAENYVRNQVHNQVIDPIRTAAQDFLGRFGTAQLQFDVSDQARLNNVNVKLFSPWYDSENTLIFSQLTYQEYEKDRRIGNFGIGQRWDVADNTWLLGYNVFFDHDFSRNHNRLGLGLEAWSDYMKFAANYYTPLSDWKDSKDFDDYLERAARGFDIRFQGYLPSYPHLGGSLMFEQYFGDKVALFGKDRLQKDPYAVTVGVDYTPVPLFTIKGEHKQGQDARKQAKVELTMNYRLGVPLKDQLDPNMVQVARSLKGSRYDLVDRNNYIVLEYKEKKFSVDLAALGEFEEQSIVPLGIVLHNAKGTLSPLVWNNATGTSDLFALVLSGAVNGGDLCYNRGSSLVGTVCPTGQAWNQTIGSATNDISNWTVRVPDYIDPATGERNPTKLSGVSVPGRYTFDVTLTDSNGRTATSNTSWLAIKPSSLRAVLLNNVTPIPAGGTGALGSSTDPAPVDGSTTVLLEAYLDNNGNGAHDYGAYSMFPPVASTPSGPLGLGVTQTVNTAAITQADIDRLNELYTIKSGSNAVTLVNGNTYSSCSVASVPNCLLVKEIEEVTGDNTASTATDKYRIKVATTTELGQVDIQFKFPQYSSVPSETIYFSGGGTPAKIIIYDGATVVGTANSSSVITMTGAPAVGNTYTAVVEDSTGTDITATSNITWSLVGDNFAACFAANNTILRGDTNPGGDDPTGSLPVTALFDVSNTSTYTIRGLALPNPSYAGNVSSATTGGAMTSFSGNALASVRIGGSRPLPYDACAGDQGFKLRIDVN